MLERTDGSELQWEFTKELVRFGGIFNAKIFAALRHRQLRRVKSRPSAIALGYFSQGKLYCGEINSGRPSRIINTDAEVRRER
jgi:hypothetical protein